MINYLNIIRYKNLILIAFLQFTMHQMVIVPILQTYRFDSTFWVSNLIYLLILGTLLIAAGGYVLNDYFDAKIDAINHPKDQIVGKSIEKSHAMIFHQILTVIGVIIGLTVAFFAQSFTIAFIYIVVPGLLWFYSASYKRQFMMGNLVIAFISALTVLIVGIVHIAFLEKEYGKLLYETDIPRKIYSWIGGFAFFSFLLTWIREIIKDLEDIEGDKEMECRTMAIVWGFKKSKLFVYFLVLLTISTLILSDVFLIKFEGDFSLQYILYGICLPLIILIYLLVKAQTPKEFHQVATLCKYIMFIGIMYSFAFNFFEAKQYGITLFGLFKII